MVRLFFIILSLYLLNTSYAFAQSRTIKVETVPSGADAEIKFYSWGTYTEEHSCKTPCEYKTDSTHNYNLSISKQGFAGIVSNGSDPYGLKNIPDDHKHKTYLTTLYSGSHHLKADKVGAVETYKFNLETSAQKDLRRAKKRLAKYCTTIFRKHFQKQNADARPCQLTRPDLPLKFKKKKAHCNFTYDLTRTGEIVDFRNFNCSHDSLVKEIKYKSYRSSRDRWLYLPKIENGQAVETLGLSTDIDFYKPVPERECLGIFAKYEDQLNYDAIVCKREDLKIRKKISKTQEKCIVIFDVTEKGYTDNVKIESCTLKAFAKPVINSVKTWLYVPMHIDGHPMRRTGMKAKLTYIPK